MALKHYLIWVYESSGRCIGYAVQDSLTQARKIGLRYISEMGPLAMASIMFDGERIGEDYYHMNKGYAYYNYDSGSRNHLRSDGTLGNKLWR